MHIVSAADERFLPHFCAMLHSAWLFHPDARYTLIAYEVSESMLTRLLDFAGKRNIALDIVSASAKHVEGLPIRRGFAPAIYLRVLLPELLPQSVERVIYLDADITLTGKLDGLFALDMGGMPFAAAPDSENGLAIERSFRDLPDDFRYHNAGVFLADLALWRRENIGGQIVSFVRTTREFLPFLDQSAINIVLHGRILPLDRAFNVFAMEYFDEVPNPIVIHYAGVWKPWRVQWSAFHELYRFHRNQTPWPLREFGPTRLKDLRHKVGDLVGLPRYRKISREIRNHRHVKQLIGDLALERAIDLLKQTEARRETTNQGIA